MKRIHLIKKNKKKGFTWYHGQQRGLSRLPPVLPLYRERNPRWSEQIKIIACQLAIRPDFDQNQDEDEIGQRWRYWQRWRCWQIWQPDDVRYEGGRQQQRHKPCRGWHQEHHTGNTRFHSSHCYLFPFSRRSLSNQFPYSKKFLATVLVQLVCYAAPFLCLRIIVDYIDIWQWYSHEPIKGCRCRRWVWFIWEYGARLTFPYYLCPSLTFSLAWVAGNVRAF